jgi:glycosyltransferase involved in cell wall biosynthesis
VGFKLDQLLVISDGSTDDTVVVAKNVSGLPLAVHVNHKRIGLANSLNYIFNQAKTDIVVTLDADIRLQSTLFLTRLLTPILRDMADYTTSSIKEISPKSFFAASLALSMQVKRNIYQVINSGNNLYTSFGLARAYNRKMYTKMRFPSSVGNDMYSYLYAKSRRLRFEHVPSASALYHLPTRLSDSTGQSVRFYQARRSMDQYFDKQLVDESIRIPPNLLFIGIVSSMEIIYKRPLHCLAYLGYIILTLITSLHINIEDRWDIATTTKHE